MVNISLKQKPQHGANVPALRTLGVRPVAVTYVFDGVPEEKPRDETYKVRQLENGNYEAQVWRGQWYPVKKVAGTNPPNETFTMRMGVSSKPIRDLLPKF
jgi:hypothetical protein